MKCMKCTCGGELFVIGGLLAPAEKPYGILTYLSPWFFPQILTIVKCGSCGKELWIAESGQFLMKELYATHCGR